MKLILTVTYGDHDTWEHHIGIEAESAEALCFAILEAVDPHVKAREEFERRHALTPAKRKPDPPICPYETEMVFNGQKFEVVTLEFSEYDIQTLDEFFEQHKAERKNHA
jgi:hypothetical protein